MTHVIISPHGDDEIIGCFEILNDLKNRIEIIYGHHDLEAKRFCYEKNNIIRYYIYEDFHIPDEILNPNNIYYFPDPTSEIHPDHVTWGAYGERLLRLYKFNVVFYSINMMTRYIKEVKNPSKKLELLNKYYPSKESLWKYDHKYFLFEGRCKWMIHD